MLVEAADEAEELRACARWVRQFIEDTKRADRRDRSGSGSAAYRDRSCLPAVLAPELEDIGAAHAAPPYEFSVGVSLAMTPMVAAH